MYTYEMYMKSENGLDSLNKESSGAVEIMTGATSSSDGKEGLVPVPTIDKRNKFLKGDGTWSQVQYAEQSNQSFVDGDGNYFSTTYTKKKEYGNTVNIGRKLGESAGEHSFAFGNRITAKGDYSFAVGIDSIAIGKASISLGVNTEANSDTSFAVGCYTISDNYASNSCGKYNAPMVTGGNFDNTTGTAFTIGNGIDYDVRSNAFSVMFDGTTKAASTITAETTADYAEFFEWEDNNPNTEDRVGKFVTLHGDKIAIATSNEEYILGIVSGAPFVLGNGDCDVWTGMWLRDEFNRVIYEPAPKMEIDEKTGTMKEVFDEDGNLVYEGKRRKLNPEYDSTQKYISRFDRPEWAPVGMLGVLSVIQDGTCEINGYCCCNENGIATACDRNTVGAYRVIKKISDQVVRVVFR